MFDENQLIKIKWSRSNKKDFMSLGYGFTKFGDTVMVKAKDLKPNSDTKVKAICDYCGKEYETLIRCIIGGRKKIQKDACYSCCGLKMKEATLAERSQKAFRKAQEFADKNGYVIITTTKEFHTVFDKITFICPKHGEQSSTFDNFIHGHGCYFCGRESVGDKLRREKNELISVININGNVLLNPDEYVSSTMRNLKIRCSCGEVFTTSYVNYVKHGVNKCPKCSFGGYSTGEYLISEFLDANYIPYIPEMRFQDCRDKKPLPFDFYLYENNTIIEFDGEQHYRPAFGEESFRQTVLHDKIKNEYCEQRNIDLIRIPYWEKDQIFFILKEKLIA